MAYAPVNRILLGAVAPIIIYYVGRKLGMALTGAIVSSIWCLGIMAWHWTQQGEFDGFSGIGAAYGVSELAGLLITRNPDWFLLSPVVSDWVLGSVFLLSMLAHRPLIQVLAEQTAGKKAFPEHIRLSKYYRLLWLRLSMAWGGVYMIKGGVKWTILTTLPVEAYLSARIFLDWPAIIGMTAFSYWYPKYYWQRAL